MGIPRRAVVAVAALIILGTSGIGTAWADPVGAKDERHVTLSCGGAPMDAVVNGVGNWVIAHALSSTKVFIPVQFLGESGVFTDANGVEHPFSEPAGSPRANPQGRVIVDCTFAVDTTFSDGSRVIANGSLRGFFSA